MEEIEANPDRADTIPSLIEEEEDEPEKKGKRKIEDLKEMKSVDDITSSLKQDETEFEVAATLVQMQIYHDRIEDLKKTQHLNLDSIRQLFSNVKECKTKIHMEIDDSRRTLITYTGRYMNNVPLNPPKRIVMIDSYDVGECSEPVSKKRKHMEVDNSEKTQKHTLRNKNDLLKNLSNGCDSNEVEECSKPERKPRKQIEIDDTNETLEAMIGWKEKIENMNNPPRKMFSCDFQALGRCSKPVIKQVMESDINVQQCRLMLGKEQVKKMMEEVLGKEENPGIKGRQVSVYGRDGQIFEMTFKMWGDKTPVLASSNWSKFVKIYEIDTLCHFFIIWMFKHQLTDKLCFAIDFDTLGVNAKLSN